MADAISIQETNKIRKSLGLPLLPVPGSGPAFKEASGSGSEGEEEEKGSTLESRQAQGYDNWKRLQDEAAAKSARETRKDAVKKARDAAQRFSKLGGKGLGDEDEGELDTRAWLMGQKKRQKKLERERERAKKLEEELREREERAYTSKDLAGVKVAHELGDFDIADGEQILTLKDATIDENEEEGDELENIELREKHTLGERLDLKKKRPVYNPNDVEEDGEKALLKQYDEVVNGKKRKRFTLDVDGSTVEEKEALEQTVAERLKMHPISLDVLKDMNTSDYAEPKDIRVRKPKKDKAKSTRAKATDDDDIFPLPDTNGNGDIMDIDTGSHAPRTNHPQNISFVDDEDLQASLAKQRMDALKKRKKTRLDDLAEQLRQEEAIVLMEADEDADSGLVIDETTFFVDNLGERQREREEAEEAKERARQEDDLKANAKSPQPDDDQDVEMSKSDVEGDLDSHARRETSTPAPETTGLDAERTFDKGIGAAFSLLTERGLVEKPRSSNMNASDRQRDAFRAAKRQREAAAAEKARQQRERDRLTGRFDRTSAREREEYARRENIQRDLAVSREEADAFNKGYKPNVQLKYIDDHGREMGLKEAFKAMSHQFHGKGSGKQKTEKHLKKIAEEKKELSKSSLDNSQMSNMNSAAGATARKNRTAGVRLA